MNKYDRIEIIRQDVFGPWLKVVSFFIWIFTFMKIITGKFFELSIGTYIVINGLTILFWTTFEYVTIDMERKFGEGYKVAGIKSVTKYRFDSLEKIFINHISTSKTFRQLTRTMTIRDGFYKAFLKTNRGDKIFIDIDRDKDDLLNRLRDYNTVLNTVIVDNTL